MAASLAPATFYAVTGGGADFTWRCRWPAKAIGAKTCIIYDRDVNALLAPHEGEPFPWRVRDDDLFEYPAHEGAAVWTRPDKLRAVHAVAMREQGALTVAEVDDNYLSDTHLNMFMRANRYGPEQRRAHLEAMAQFDRIVFSTSWLRDEYVRTMRRELPKFARRFLPATFVARNHVDMDDWPERLPSREDGKLRVGFMGSAQHARDVKLAYPAMLWAKEHGHEVVFIGNDIRDEAGVTKPAAVEWCRAWRDVIDTYIPWVAPEEFHRTAFPIDIGLAPLERNRHTMGKSDIKAIEYWMWGAAPVCSRGTVFEPAVQDGVNGLLASSPGEFMAAVKLLCENPGLRDEMAAAGAEYVRNERTIQGVGRREWMEAVS